jgi:hypothetical protein
LAGGRFFFFAAADKPTVVVVGLARIFLRFTRKNQQESSGFFMKTLNILMRRCGLPAMPAYVCPDERSIHAELMQVPLIVVR